MTHSQLAIAGHGALEAQISENFQQQQQQNSNAEKAGVKDSKFSDYNNNCQLAFVKSLEYAKAGSKPIEHQLIDLVHHRTNWFWNGNKSP